MDLGRDPSTRQLIEVEFTDQGEHTTVVLINRGEQDQEDHPRRAAELLRQSRGSSALVRAGRREWVGLVAILALPTCW
jgi:hypothetical protein